MVTEPGVRDGEIARGLASWYGERFHGRRTASGEVFDMNQLTAAHKTLPFGTLVRVRHIGTGKEVTVRINDRGPHVPGRIIDLSRAAASTLGIVQSGVGRVALFPE
nr:septal ring lytic transglycosylase RlpA family protein [Hydrogenophaga laconesensis]